MSLMTAQPPLSPIPGEARPIGAAAGIVEDADGGRVFVHGNLTFAWDAGDVAGRRLAAVQLVRIGAAGQKQVAAAFGTAPLTVWRWTRALAEAGVVGLVGERMGPKRKSKLTTDIVAEIVTLRGQGLTLRTIADRVGVSEGSVRNALEAGSETVEDCATTGSDAPVESPPGSESGTSPEPESGFESDDVESGSSSGAGLPVLPGPVDRRGQRGAARWGLLEYAPPVFAPAARVRLAGLFLAVPALAATGLLEGAHATYGQLPRGFYGLDTVVCEAVFRALLGESRAEGATRIDPIELGRVLGLDRAPEVKTIRRRIALLAAQAKADKWIAAMAHTYAAAHPEQMGVLYVDGHVRAYQGTRKVAKTHVARLKFPAPATVETWISDAAGDPVLVVMAEPAASLASELRRLIPDLRAIVGDGRRSASTAAAGPRSCSPPSTRPDSTPSPGARAPPPTSTRPCSPSTPTPTRRAARIGSSWPTPRSSWRSPTPPAPMPPGSRCVRSPCTIRTGAGRCTS